MFLLLLYNVISGFTLRYCYGYVIVIGNIFIYLFVFSLLYKKKYITLQFVFVLLFFPTHLVYWLIP